MSVDVDAPAGAGPSSDPGAATARVTAVLVVHDGAQWLPRTLAALASSTRRPDLVVAVDAGSRDRSAVLLDTAVGSTPTRVLDAVVTGGRHDGFGTSVARGLAVADSLVAEAADPAPRSADPAGPADHGAGEEWVWLLHDDSAPEPDALEQLLGVVAASPTLAVAGCKQREWDDPTRLVEVGATVSSGGRRLTDVAAGDIDQGQHDARGDVLLVSTAGMLVRRSVLDRVGGFDESIPLVGDDVDLCLRIRRAGHRVAVVPTAAVRHVAALERGQRRADALHGALARRLGTSAPHAGGARGGLASARRRHWLHARLVQAPTAVLPLLWLWVLLVTPVRALGWLLRGHPGRAAAELDATARLVARGWRVAAARWRSRRARVVPASTLRLLQRGRTQVLREDVDAWRARRSLRREAAAEGEDDGVPIEALESGPVDDDLIDLDLGAAGPARRFFGHPLTYLVPLALAVGALAPLRRLAAPPAVDAEGAEVVLADPTAGLTAAELFSRALSGWRDVGLGAVGVADPATAVWAGITGLVQVLGGGVAATTVGDARVAVLVAAPVLGLLAAYVVLRRLVRSRAASAAGALTWALLPSTGLLGVHHAGDVVVHVVLPLLLGAMAGCLGRRDVRSLAATGLLSALVVALEPATWPVLVVVAVLVGVVGGVRSQASWRACLPLVGVVALPALVWTPWLPVLRRDPEVLLLDPAGVDPTLVALPAAGALLGTAGRARDVLAGRVGVTEDPVPLLVAGTLLVLVVAVVVALLLALAALARRRVPGAWCALLAALAAGAVGVAALVVERATASPASVPASAGLLALGVLVALLVRDLHDPDRPAPRDDVRGRRLLGAAVRAATPLLPAAVVLAAVAASLLVPPPSPPQGLPSPALVGSQSPQATRTLLLDAAPGRAPQDAAAPPAGVPGATTPEPDADVDADVGAADAAADPAAGDAPDAVPGTTTGEVVSWRVTAGQPGPGQASVAMDLNRPDVPVRPGERRLADVVASLLGDGSVPGEQVAGALAESGVGWVVVRGSAPLDTALAQRAGLVRTAVEAGRTTWRVDSVGAGTGPVPARARLVAADGSDLGPIDLRAALDVVTVDSVVDRDAPDGPATGTTLDDDPGTAAVTLPAGPPGRVLALADNARNGWRATVDGTALTPTTVDGWAQGFLLPAGGGELVVTPPMARPATLTVSAVALAVLALALLWPGRRRQGLVDVGRRPVAPVPDPRSRRVRRAGRTLVATGALAGTVAVLLVATGVGVGPGAWQADRQVRALLAGSGPGAVLADQVVSAVEGLPARPDPLAVAPVVSLASAGTVQTCAVPGGDEPVTPVPDQAADRSALRGLTLRVEREGDERGLSLAACPSTAAEAWVVLGGTAVGERPRLVLANPGETGAVVDVRVGGPDGPVETPASTGLLVAPGERAEVALDALAPDLPALLVHVVARSGTVAVTATETGLAGLVPQGGDSVPASVAPARRLVLPGVVVPGDGTGELLVGSVGDSPAVVRARAVAEDGTVVALPGPSLPVAPAGGVVSSDLGDLPAGTWTLLVEADAPVVASASWTRRGDGEPAEGVTGVPVDEARVQAVPAGTAWTTPVRLPLQPLLETDGALAGAVLTVVGAGEGAGRARLEVVGASGDVLASRALEVPAGGAPLDVPLGELVGDLDRAEVAALGVRSATGVHLGLRVTLPDADGPLVGGTAVPSAPVPPRDVRLLRD